eukprot:1070999-Rhodomonas_salina.4
MEQTGPPWTKIRSFRYPLSPTRVLCDCSPMAIFLCVIPSTHLPLSPYERPTRCARYSPTIGWVYSYARPIRCLLLICRTKASLHAMCSTDLRYLPTPAILDARCSQSVG